MNVMGKTVCVTGVLAGLKRDEAEAGLAALGAKVVGSVSKSCDVLFVGAQAGSKLAKAKELGVETLTEAQVRTILGKTSGVASKKSKARPRTT